MRPVASLFERLNQLSLLSSFLLRNNEFLSHDVINRIILVIYGIRTKYRDFTSHDYHQHDLLTKPKWSICQHSPIGQLGLKFVLEPQF